jgi:hypothetical protein
MRRLLGLADRVIEERRPLVFELEVLEDPRTGFGNPDSYLKHIYGRPCADWRGTFMAQAFWNEAEFQLKKSERIGFLRRKIAAINKKLEPLDEYICEIIDLNELQDELAFDKDTGDLVLITQYPTKIYRVY